MKHEEDKSRPEEFGRVYRDAGSPIMHPLCCLNVQGRAQAFLETLSGTLRQRPGETGTI